MILARLNSSAINRFYRIIKSVWGNNVTETSNLAVPYGMDCNPPQNEITVVAETGNNSDSIVVGFVTKNVLEDLVLGECGLYAKDANGGIVATIKMRNSGDVEVNGNDDFMVRFSKLEEAFNELQDRYNELAQRWSIFANAYVPGGPTVQGSPPTASNADLSEADISLAKIENVKTNSGNFN